MHYRFLAAPLAVGAALLFAAGAQAHGPSRQAVYTQTNSAAGNAVQVLARGDDGRLTPAGTLGAAVHVAAAGCDRRGLFQVPYGAKRRRR